MNDTYLLKLRSLLMILDESVGVMKDIENHPSTPNRVRINVFDARQLIETSKEVLGKYALYDSLIV